MEQARISVERKRVLVVGGGVIGLSVALALLRHPSVSVTLVAREHANDAHTANFASPRAGAVWHPFTDVRVARQSEWEECTFAAWYAMKGGDGQIDKQLVPQLDDSILALVPMHRIMLHADDPDASTVWQSPWWKDVVQDFRIDGSRQYCRTFALHPTAYLNALLDACRASSRFVAHTATVVSLSSAKALYAPDAAVVVNATGLGAAALADVLDALVEPIRGQTVIVKRSPSGDRSTEKDELACVFVDEVPSCRDVASTTQGYECTYVIPRACSDDVFLGGTAEVGSYDVRPSEQQARRIVRQALHHHPQLRQLARPRSSVVVVQEDQEEEEDRPETDDECDARLIVDLRRESGLHVIGVDVGLRPSRRDGARLDWERRPDLDVVHAYGFGRTGFQCSWGVAEEVSSLVRIVCTNTASQ